MDEEFSVVVGLHAPLPLLEVAEPRSNGRFPGFLLPVISWRQRAGAEVERRINNHPHHHPLYLKPPDNEKAHVVQSPEELEVGSNASDYFPID
jgi:hypothetical protein